jgi:hypothetical protein
LNNVPGGPGRRYIHVQAKPREVGAYSEGGIRTEFRQNVLINNETAQTTIAVL